MAFTFVVIVACLAALGHCHGGIGGIGGIGGGFVDPRYGLGIGQVPIRPGIVGGTSYKTLERLNRRLNPVVSSYGVGVGGNFPHSHTCSCGIGERCSEDAYGNALCIADSAYGIGSQVLPNGGSLGIHGHGYPRPPYHGPYY